MAGVQVRGSDLSILIIVPVALIALTWFLDRTTIGRTVKACASNPQLARLSSISPKIVSTLVWALAAGLSTLSIVLIAGQSGSAGDVTTLGDQTLSLALVAAVIAGMTSFRRAIVASIVIGLAQSLISFNFINTPGLINLLLLIAVLVAVAFNRDKGEDHEVFAFTPRARPIPVAPPGLPVGPQRQQERADPPRSDRHHPPPDLHPALDPADLHRSGRVRHLCHVAHGAHGMARAAVPRPDGHLPDSAPSSRPDWWKWGCRSGWPSRSPPWRPRWLAVVLGLGSLRVRGLYLAVVTFVFALAAQQYFFNLPILSGQSTDGANLPFVPGKLFSLSFPGQRTYYYVVLVVLGLVLLVVSRFRDSGVGRSIMAVRDNENAASAFMVRPAWEKIRAFSIAGALAGLGGALLAGAYANVEFSGPGSFFLVDGSLGLVAMVVIGGMGSVTAAVIGAIWVIGIPALAPNNLVLGLLSSSIGLLAILLYFPRGLNQISYDVRDAVLAWADRRFGKDAPVPEARRPRWRPDRNPRPEKRTSSLWPCRTCGWPLVGTRPWTTSP